MAEKTARENEEQEQLRGVEVGAHAKHLAPRPPLDPLIVPARMVNEVLYCERLAYLEWVQGEWADNGFTAEGTWAHRRADTRSGGLPESGEPDRPYVARSVWLSSEKLGLSAKIDVVEGEGDVVLPVEYKRGSPPDVPEGAYLPERAQVCAQALLLRDHGMTCDEGALYFAAAKRRVPVVLDAALVATTLGAIETAKSFAQRSQPPPPLVDSPKCNGCSLVGICLPDETNALRTRDAPLSPPTTSSAPEPSSEESASVRSIRRLHPARDDRKPVYVQEQGARVGLEGDVLVVRTKTEKHEARLFETSHVALYGNVSLSAQATRTLAERGIPVMLFTYGGWLTARLTGDESKNVEMRIAQYRAAEDAEFCLRFARAIVAAKIRNCRTLLRRNHREPKPVLLKQLEVLAKQAEGADSPTSLLGFEGSAAKLYFGAFSGMFRGEGLDFDLDGRNRRPPKDPVNAILSFAYGLLAKDLTVAALAASLDPMRGFFHQPRFGRSSLSLDLMEEMRPLIADSVVLHVLNNGVLDKDDFLRHREGVALTASARRKVIEAYERRLQQEITHPLFGYAVSWRRVLEIQARLLGRVLLGEVDAYPAMRTR